MADLAAVQAYQAAVRAAQQSNMGTQPEPTSGLDFGNMVTSAIADTTGAVANAEQMSAAAAAGEAELLDVVTVSYTHLTLPTILLV